MKHIISLSTTDILLINKALRLDMQNDLDNELAERLIDKLNNSVIKNMKNTVVKDMKKTTDLKDKCGSCVWATPRKKCYVNCNCPQKKPNWFSRTRVKCSFYKLKGNGTECE